MKRIFASNLLCLALGCLIGGNRAPHVGASSAPAARRDPSPARAFVSASAVPVLAPARARPAPSVPSTDDLLAWAGEDPAAAGAWLRDRPDDVARQQMLAAVIRHWMSLEPRAAADFALSLPDLAARARALEQVACTWVARDPVSASAWAESLPVAPELDTFAAAIATIDELASRHRDTALSWADAITDEQLRARCVDAILAARTAHDPAAPTIYLVTTPGGAPARKTL